MYVAAKSQRRAAAAAPPVIVPNDPPNFTSCVAAGRDADPDARQDAPTKTLETDCKQLFTQLNQQVMDFLIEGYWYQAEAHKLGHQGHRRCRSRQAFNKRQEAQFQDASRVPELPEVERPDHAGPALPVPRQRRSTRSCSSASLEDGHRRARSRLLQGAQVQFGTPETPRPADRPRPRPRRRRRPRNALKTGQSWDTVAKKYSVDADDQEQRRRCCRASPRARRSSALNKGDLRRR